MWFAPLVAAAAAAVSVTRGQARGLRLCHPTHTRSKAGRLRHPQRELGRRAGLVMRHECTQRKKNAKHTEGMIEVSEAYILPVALVVFLLTRYVQYHYTRVSWPREQQLFALVSSRVPLQLLPHNPRTQLNCCRPTETRKVWLLSLRVAPSHCTCKATTSRLST